jgi:nitrate/TMAO reductase-like tetraheme cytochrome c subunit
MKLTRILPLFTLFLLSGYNVSAQISPGDLSNVHAYLEGVSNCTKCHEVENKVTREKCFVCHNDIKQNIAAGKGYHASSEVTGKECFECHNEHHGRNFKIIRFDKKTFNHRLTGFELKGEHARQDCKACHNPEFISDPRLKNKSATYLGLKQGCLNCHEDYHQGKLSSKCTNCHGFDTFKKATGFDHNATRFPLLGQHKNVKCIECHKTEIVNGKPVQKFTGLQFDNCTACHKDVHKNKFGQNCKLCHTEESFHFNKGMKAFDHDKTNFKLFGEHKLVDCKQCHTASLTTPLKHDHCTDCHSDFHKKEFEKNGVSPDCNKCHTNNGFSPSTYTIEKHNASGFKLEAAHLATSCLACHKKENVLTFKNMGKRCVDCHENVHKGFIDEKFLPNEDCTACHNIINWKTVNFDHNKTGFKLEGAHSKQECSACHYRKNEDGKRIQQFAGLPQNCSNCHKDHHAGQFEVNGISDCKRCHGFNDWKESKFDHNTSRFKLEGEHVSVKCEECHKPVMDTKGKYIQYKFDDISCSKCHG